MAFWLFKTEPQEFSIDDLATAGKRAAWDGIRNYQARNFLRDAVAKGDEVLIYHSGIARPEIVGSAQVVRGSYPDPAQFDPASPYHDPRASTGEPRWYSVDITLREKFRRPLPLLHIRTMDALADMALLRQGRLSVAPVTTAEWAVILDYCQGAASTCE